MQIYALIKTYKTGTVLFLFLFLATLSYSQCWQQVEVGNGSIWAIQKNGTLWTGGNSGRNDTWTSSGSTVLISNTSVFLPFPTQVGTDNKWKKIISTKEGSQYAIKTDGTIWGWGNNGNSELGIGNVNQYVPNPVQIGTDNDWQEISAGRKFAVAIKQDGSLWSWGYNLQGQLGLGNQVHKNIPVRVGTGNDWNSVFCGDDCSFAIKSNGTLWTWGSALNGGYLNLSPLQVGSGNDWKSACLEYSHGLLLKNNNTLWGAGTNSACRELTSNFAVMSSFTNPVQIGTENDWNSIALSMKGSYAIKQDGSLWRWGWNQTGSYCDGTNQINSPIPFSLNNVTQFSVKWGSYAAIHSNGKLSIWGNDVFTSQKAVYRADPTVVGSQSCPCLCSQEDRFRGNVFISTQGKIIDSVFCNKSITKKLTCNINYGFFAPAYIDTKVCTAKDSLLVRSSTGTVITPAAKTNISDPFIVNFSKPGTYNLVFLITRNGKTCKECSITVMVECPVVKDIKLKANRNDIKAAEVLPKN